MNVQQDSSFGEQLLVIVLLPVSQARAFPDYSGVAGVLRQHAAAMCRASKFHRRNRELEKTGGRACPFAGPVCNTVVMSGVG